jgi:hypothetical protein
MTILVGRAGRTPGHDAAVWAAALIAAALLALAALVALWAAFVSRMPLIA